MFSNSTGVFGRWTGKRQPSEQTSSGTVSPALQVPAESDRSKTTNGHRRDSSILSISSVTELGGTVKRSLSTRSHKSQPSDSSYKLGHRRFPSSGNLKSSLTNSTFEEEEPQDIPLPPPIPQSPPRSRGKLSISGRSISSKFKSSETLPTFSPSDQLDGSFERPATSVEIRKIPSSSSMLTAPTVPRRAPPDRPTLQPQSSFSREPSSLGPNGSLQPAPIAPPTSAGGLNPQAIYQHIHETSAKRMATIEYMRKVHDGNIFYFGTLHYSQASLQSIPSMHPLKLARRANNYLILGYSLPTLLDMNSGSPMEYLRALSSLLQEFETYQNLSGFDSSGNSLSRGRVGNMFNLRNKNKGRRSSTATESMSIQHPDFLGLPKSATEAMSPQETPSPISPSGHDFQHLVTPHLPFDPDFGTTYATLCDTLIDTYAKLMDLISTPDLCGPGVGDAFTKADKAVRKILVTNVMRDFEDSARASVKGEVAGLGTLVLGGLM